MPDEIGKTIVFKRKSLRFDPFFLVFRPILYVIAIIIFILFIFIIHMQINLNVFYVWGSSLALLMKCLAYVRLRVDLLRQRHKCTHQQRHQL